MPQICQICRRLGALYVASFLIRNSHIMSQPQGSRIAIIGAGKVGAAAAYSIIHRQIASEVLLLDIKEDFLDAQVQDLRDSTSFGISPRVKHATWKECGQCDIIVFTGGTNQKGGESRLALVQRNISVIKSGFEQMKPFGENTILVMVTNPVDIMTYFALKYTGLPPHRVFGSGTILDTTRLKDAIAQKAEVAPRSVHGYVIGEHGDSQVIAWSNITIGGIPLDNVLPLEDEEKHELAEFIRFKADRLNRVKGETSFGIGAVLANICSSILLDERNVVPLSHFHADHGICFNKPAILGRAGIIRTLDIPLEENEVASLERSIAKLKGVIVGTESPGVPVTEMSSRL
ncbi:l-lactate dehydrogenase [Poronia punctata]|nr:l-lactate dehydrogenase [Poronia punctata]